MKPKPWGVSAYIKLDKADRKQHLLLNQWENDLVLIKPLGCATCLSEKNGTKGCPGIEK